MDHPLPTFLVCPITKSPLHREGDVLISQPHNPKYPIRDGLPILLPEAAILPTGFHTLEEFKTAFSSSAKTQKILTAT